MPESHDEPHSRGGILNRLIGLVLLFGVCVGEAEVVVRVSAGNQMYWVEQVAEDLSFPSSMAWLPNGDILILEREGGLRVLRNGKLDSKPVSGTPPSFKNTYNGLKDIALDPDFRSNRLLYLLICEGTADRHYAAVYRARYGAQGLENVTRIFRIEDESGGLAGFGSIATRLLMLSDGTLLLAPPDERKQAAQQLGSHLGKILRINRDGAVPHDNPFIGKPGALKEIWSYGHRAVLGLYQDLESAEVFELESGERGGDELNLLKAGGNFGWGKASWSFDYAGGAAAPAQSGSGIEDPILIWMPSVTPAGLTRYRGKVFPLWNGDFFLGYLSGKGLERVRLDGRRVVVQERMLLDLEERIRDVSTGPDGYLYLLTDHPQGRLLRLQPGHTRAGQLARVAHKLESWAPQTKELQVGDLQPGDPARGRQAFMERCAACHRVGALVPGGAIGPDLAGVYGRLMGRKAGFDYSPSMMNSLLPWNAASLNKFLADPNGAVAGTKMAAPPIADAEMRRHIIGFLKQQSGK